MESGRRICLRRTFFYTDTHAEKAGAQSWMGDRIDLDLLASLVQPLTPQGRGRVQQDEDEIYDDSKLIEEAERREIDAKKGKATGEERTLVPSSSSEALDRAVTRLVRKVDRAASNIERALADREKLSTVSPRAIARQIWMVPHCCDFGGPRGTSRRRRRFRLSRALAFCELHPSSLPGIGQEVSPVVSWVSCPPKHGTGSTAKL